MERVAILAGARTPFGKFGGGLSSLSAAELGGWAIKEALTRSNLSANQVDEVIVGNVLQAGQGQIPSRQAARHAGLPWDVETETVNKVCASGMRSVTLAEQIIRSGDKHVIIAGGMESMSNAPYMLPNVRWGMRMGTNQVVDVMVHDGLTCPFTGVHMGNYGNETAHALGIARKAQDEWAYRSHQLAIAAQKSGKLAEEIVPIEVKSKRGHQMFIDEDEAPREDTTLERLEKLPPVFDKDGTLTAGNAPGVNDGAAALVLMNGSRVKQEGYQPLATIIGHAAIAVEPNNFPKTPGLVINKLLKQTKKSLNDINLFEINEAFAAVALASNQIAGLDQEKVNVNGGAVALGHPIGASGTRIILTLIYELRRRGGGIGIAAICSGGGQGDAIMVEV